MKVETETKSSTVSGIRERGLLAERKKRSRRPGLSTVSPGAAASSRVELSPKVHSLERLLSGAKRDGNRGTE